MAITVVPRPRNLSWENFENVRSLPDEEAHIDIGFDVPNRPFRRVDGVYRMAETFTLTVRPVAKVVRTASKTATLLSHEQGHYNIGILTGRAMARDFAGLEADSPQALAAAITTAFDLHRSTRMGAIQEKYDDDTDHSLNRGEQQRWDDLIFHCMQSNPNCGRLDGLDL